MNEKTKPTFTIMVFPSRRQKQRFTIHRRGLSMTQITRGNKRIGLFYSGLAENYEYWLCLTAIENSVKLYGIFPRERHKNMSKPSMKR